MIRKILDGLKGWGMAKAVVLVVLLGLLAFSLKDALRQPGSGNLHTHQANAFLRGRLDIPEYKEYVHDLAEYEGRKYVVFPPFPAILLVPGVALFGIEKTNVVLLCLVLTLLNVAVLKRILGQIKVERALHVWFIAAFFMGTAYWYCLVNSSGIWFYAHVVAVTCLLLAISEALGKGRGYLVGFCLGAALLSRQLSIYSYVFLCAALWCNPAGKTAPHKLVNLALFSICFGLCAGVYCLFNLARFGNMFDTGYQYMSLQSFLLARVEKYGVFNVAYVPFNFIHMFVQGFHATFIGREQLLPQLDRFGTSLTVASPFVFLAFWSRGSRLFLAAAWASVAFTLLHLLFYYNNGFVQLNAQRFTLDFMPILILLIALGASRCSRTLTKGLIVYAVVLNVITMVGIPFVNDCFLR